MNTGLEATITDPDKNLISIKNVEIVVESKDDDKIQVSSPAQLCASFNLIFLSGSGIST